MLDHSLFMLCYRFNHKGTYPAGHGQQSIETIIERKVTPKGGHRTKSKFGGSESVDSHGLFLAENINPTATVYSDESGVAKSTFMTTKFDIGSCNHSKGHFVNPNDYGCQSSDQRGCNIAENSHKKLRIRRRKRNGDGARNVFITETSHRQLALFWENWMSCYTNNKPKDILVTWWSHCALLYRKIPIDS